MNRVAREDWLAIALLALLVVATFANVVFGGRSLVASENLDPLDDRPQVLCVIYLLVSLASNRERRWLWPC